MSSLIPKKSVLPARIQDWLRNSQLPSLIRDNKKPITIAITSILTSVTLPILYQDYRNFLRLGPGGVPHNVLGWLTVSLVMCPFGCEMFSTEVYDSQPDKRRLLSDEQVPRREGGRPLIGRHVVPQRQLDQIPGREIKEVGCFHQIFIIVICCGCHQLFKLNLRKSSSICNNKVKREQS
jgi:hypothetical protein